MRKFPFMTVPPPPHTLSKWFRGPWTLLPVQLEYRAEDLR